MNMQIGTSTSDTVLVHRFNFTQMALTYANEVEAVPVSSSRFHTIKALSISHTTIASPHISTENTSLHYGLR